MKQYEKAEVKIILMQTDVIQTSGPGDQFGEDIDWEI